jgi:hypothetical protein
MKIDKMTFRKISFILSLIFFAGKIFSQSTIYHPFPDVHGRWVIETSGYWDQSVQTHFSYEMFEAIDDTIIGAYTYKKVMGASSPELGCPSCWCCPATPAYGPWTYRFAYRNDVAAKKVYIYTQIGGTYTDTLWYDFNLNVGDTLKPAYSIPDHSTIDGRTIIQSIDSVLTCDNTYHKRYAFGCGFYLGDPRLVEGIGFMDNFVATGSNCPLDPAVKYETTFFCSVTSVNERSENLFINIRLFPNPASDILQLNNLIPGQTIEYSIKDYLGRTIREYNLYEDKIDVFSLSKGLYFLFIKDKEGNEAQFKFVKQ